MFEVDTLFVISSARGAYVLDDLTASISWSCRGSYFIVIVSENGTSELASREHARLIQTDLPGAEPGFHRAAGLKWAIDQGIAYRQVIFLSDTCLLTGIGLDTFFLERTQRDSVGVIGVGDQRTISPVWQESLPWLMSHDLPIQVWENPPPGLCDDVLIMAGRFVGPLYQRGLLLPADYADVRAPYGIYASWLAHMLNFYVVRWGFETQSLPPLYVNRSHGQCMPAPQNLRSEYMLFSPADKVMAYSEGHLREIYKRQRGEHHREIAAFGPVVTGPSLSNANPDG